MRTVNIHEAKTTLSALIRQVEEEGEHIRIARNGRPVAELSPIIKKRDIFRVNPALKAECFCDPTAPLDPEDWPDSEWPESPKSPKSKEPE